ncbi:MAG: sulfotransferase [Spiribacter salinus]|uniref:Sulfotransferase n=1 Tax=Spiribacter salinus TaxID=1335746 RepID=A0A540VQT7_9GAMM|nr:MAG: sulfotransferase [Spiribacter salinus]
MDKPLILIGGMPRSGTTLLSRLTSEALNVPFAPETHYFTAAYDKHGTLCWDRLPDAAKENPKLAAAYQEIRNQPKGRPAFRKLLSCLIGDSDIIGEKTPAHLTVFSDLLRHDSKIYCVVIVRDFFDVMESLRNVPWNSKPWPRDLIRCIKYWHKTSQIKRKYPQNCTAIRYRDLCEKTSEIMDLLSKRLPKGKETSMRSELFDPEKEHWKRNASQAPSTRSHPVNIRTLPRFILARICFIACTKILPIEFDQ